MMPFLAARRLIFSHEIMAICDGTPVSYRQFAADVAANAGRMGGYDGSKGLLFTRDAYWGAVGIMAMAQAGMEIIMPPNGQPGTIALIGDSFSIAVCDPAVAAAGIFSCATDSLVLESGDVSTGVCALPVLEAAAKIIFLTSGTTSAPKRVDKTLSHLRAEAQSIEDQFGSRVASGACVFGTISHQHAYGLAFRLCWPLFSGRVLIGGMYRFTESLMNDMRAQSVVVASPAHLGRLHGITALPSEKQPSLVLSAGGPLSDEAAAMANDVFGVPVTDIYGSTEAGAMGYRERDRPAPLWRPLSGVIVGQTPDGELKATGLHIPEPGRINADGVELFPSGEFRLLGRRDRIAKIEGNRINLSEVERLLLTLDDVTDAAVTVLGEPDALAAVIVLSAEGEKNLKKKNAFRLGRQLRAQLSGLVDPSCLPRRWRFVKKMPTGELGKRKHSDIAALFDAGGQ